MVVLSIYHSKMLPVGGSSETIKSAKEAFATFRKVFITFFEKKYIAWGIAFIILYRFAEGQAMKIVPLFLRADRSAGGIGLSTSQIGIIYGFFPPAAFILGSILAGYFTSKFGLRKSLFILCAFFNIPFGVYVFLAFYLPASLYTIGTAVVFEYFGYGAGFIGLTLYMMQQIAPENINRALCICYRHNESGADDSFGPSGFVSDFLGYKHFFLWVMIATIH